ncbi:GNAT family N-acetyltransferase [Mediterraneibacter gnavus]|jgi:predicted N-acetyltransferase YhbS|uniref:GNAT family N-acetyltransferase n=1 Tax=Mediterraneibacter gnavus TaxID=33038 RepID=A0A2N5Q178_MEDGN|nr:N-acetyltransferase [Mediterraneibacter gnavus]PLT87835.1 GNAT family N-acetyltransferase [Mediterraneibacter gnavus]
MYIRQETTTDYEVVYSVVKRAFESAEHADGNEQDLVNALRKGDAFLPELSLVAETDGKIVGHIMFTKATVDGNPVLALAPLSVLPEYQRKGIGTALIQEGHRIAKELGYTHSIVLGSEQYYPREGYCPAEDLGITAPFHVPRENFMAYIISETGAKIQGTIKYAPEFGIE